jgi:hypothetical protein
VNAARTHRRSSLSPRSEIELAATWNGSADDAADRVRLAVSLLPVQQRFVLFLHYYGDLGYGTIAETLGISDALELLVPPFEDEAEAWDDVLRRAGHGAVSSSRLLRRPLLLAAALLVAVGLVASAYALSRHFFVGDPAPPEVKKQASLLRVVKGSSSRASRTRRRSSSTARMPEPS